MEQYIPKSALVAEIKSRISDIEVSQKVGLTKKRDAGKKIFLFKSVLSLVDTLEVKLPIKDIWHKIGEDDLPQVGDIICCIRRGKVISGEYRANKFYGKVCDGYDNPLEKGDRWCLLTDIIEPVELKEVDLEKHLKEDIEDVLFDLDGVAVKGATHYLTVKDVKDIAKHFYELGLKAQKGE